MTVEQNQHTAGADGKSRNERVARQIAKVAEERQITEGEAAELVAEELRAEHRKLLSTRLAPTTKDADGDDQPDGDPVDFTRIVNYRDRRDSHYVFTIVDPRTGAAVDTRRIDADDLLTLSSLQEAVWTAANCVIDPPRRNSAKWRRVVKAINDGAEVVEVSEPAAADWSERLERYLGENLTTDRDEAAVRSQPFQHDGYPHVHRQSLQTFVSRNLGVMVTKQETQDALRDLGATLVTINYRVPSRQGEERRKQRDYWRLPRGEW